MNSNICVICGEKTEITSILEHRITKKRCISYFPICEKCKLEKNCFTCVYSKMWEKYWRNGDNDNKDCSKHKRKKIGDKKQDFWNAKPCNEYQKGYVSKEEWDEYHADSMLEQEWLENDNY